MLIHNAEVTGSLTINNVPFNSGSFSGSFRGDGSQLTGITGASTASYVEYNNVGNKPALVSGSSQITYSGLSGIPSGIVSGSSQVSFNGIVDKPTLVSGSSQVTYGGLSGIPAGIVSGSAQVAALGFATTGSNTFQANQTITGSLFITQNLVVAGSSSIQYISSSVLDIADNIITVNAFNPGVRFGGLAVIDSGSSPQVSGSLLFDSIKDQWIFVHQNQAVVTSSVLLMGPETYNDLGNEAYISANRLPKGSGVEHLRDSNITDTGTVVSVNSNTVVTGSFTVITGSAVELQVTNTGVNIGSALIDSHIISGSLRVNPNGLFVSGSGDIGIGRTPSSGYKVDIQGNGGLRILDNDILRSIILTPPTSAGASANLESSSANGLTLNSSNASGVLLFNTAGAERMRITSGGNIGIGVSPAAWASPAAGKVIQLGNRASVFSYNNQTLDLATNIYFDGSDYRYLESVFATLLRSDTSNGSFAFYNAASGTSGNVASFSERMRITSAGNVGIGASNPQNYGGYVTLTIGENASNRVGLLKLRSTYNSGDGAEIYQDTSGTLNFNANGATNVLTILSTGTAAFAGSIKGGAVYSLSGFANQTITISTAALVYSLDKDQGASGGSSSTTFNITGIPNQDGAFALIYARSSNTAPGFNVGMTINIHGNTVFSTSTQNVTKTATFMVFRQNGSWVTSSVGTGGVLGYP
jgi:hypothetical protein